MGEQRQKAGTALVVIEFAHMEITNGRVYKAYAIFATGSPILFDYGQQIVWLMIGSDGTLRAKHLGATISDLTDFTGHNLVEFCGFDALAAFRHHIGRFSLLHASHLSKWKWTKVLLEFIVNGSPCNPCLSKLKTSYRMKFLGIQSVQIHHACR